MKFKLFAGALATAVSMSASAGPVFSSASYNASMTFLDKNPGTTMTLAFDGTNYYSGSGGGSSSPIAKYDASGNFIASTSPTPGIDFRSVFTNSSNDVLARGFASSAIYKQTSTFGTFTQVLTLGSPTPDVQSAVVLNSQGSEYISRVVATVNRWDLAGNALAQVTLTGSPTVTATGYPSGRGIAAAGGYWLTYAAQTVYAWDYSGNLLDSALLNGAGTSFDSDFSYSFANNKFWVVDQAGGEWRGYDIGLTNGGNNGVPLPGTLALLLAGLVGLGASRRGAAVRG